MKKRCGFTLIELLAIIVILAIIAVITVPIILNVIDNAKKGAAIDSAYGFNDSISKGYLTDLISNSSSSLPSGTFIMMSNGNMTDNESNVLVTNVSGNYPEEDSWVELDKGQVIAFSYKIGDYVVTKYRDEDVLATKNGEIAENSQAREARLEAERQASAIVAARAIVDEETGTTGITDITEGWVAFINGELKAYSVSVTVGDYTYIVTDNDVNSNNSNAVASRTLSVVGDKTTVEQAIINYYSNQVATEVGTYIASLATETQGFTKDEGKKVSELTTAVPTGMDGDSWIFYDNTSSSITDYSIKMTKGGYTFIVNCTAGTVSDPVYNGTITTPQKKPASFADDSWSDIVANLTTNRNVYPIGSEKIIEFDRDNDNTNEYYKLRLVNTESCGNYTGSRTSCGVVIEFVTLIGNQKMNLSNTNAGGWYSSNMRSWLNSDVLNLLPNDLQNVIIGTAPIISGSGSGGVSDNVVASGDFTGDKLYILSGKEIGYNLSYDNKKADTDTKTLQYYVDNTGSSYKKRYTTTTSTGNDSSAAWYWLRSAYSSYDCYFYSISNNGGVETTYAVTSGGVAPAFRILD